MASPTERPKPLESPPKGVSRASAGAAQPQAGTPKMNAPRPDAYADTVAGDTAKAANTPSSAGPQEDRGSEAPSQTDKAPANKDKNPKPKASKEPKHEYQAGDLIADKYQLVRVLGEGGMGAVWLARNKALDIDVAVKLIRRERASPEAAQRLLQEARAAAKLGHPSIVRVFDFGESQYRDPFIVMEVLNGESLRDLMDRKQRLKPSRAVRTLLPIASALRAAHDKGIVHRDLKPDNILLVKEGGATVPKVVDFGIAKLVQAELDQSFTQTGQIVGSPGYMSPEQLDGRTDIDHRADVWSFAVVLYEALTGARPFEGSHYTALLSAILLKPPTPIMDYGVGDEALWKIIQKGLTKDPDLRWLSMDAMGAAIANWALERGIAHDITGISVASHWLYDGDGPPSDAAPSSQAPYIIDEDSVVLSLGSVGPDAMRAIAAAQERNTPKTPIKSLPPPPSGLPSFPPSLVPAPISLGPDSDGRFKTPPTPSMPAAPSAQPSEVSSPSRPSSVLVIDSAPKSRRRGYERPLLILALTTFAVGALGTWLTRAFLQSNENQTPIESASAPASATNAPNMPSASPETEPPPPETTATEAPPTIAEASSAQSKNANPTTPSSPESKGPGKKPLIQPSGSGTKKPSGPSSSMPLPKRPNF